MIKPHGVVIEENGDQKKEIKIDLTNEEKEVKVAKFEKEQINVDPGKGVDLHVPVADMNNLLKLQGIVNIHFHFYGGTK